MRRWLECYEQWTKVSISRSCFFNVTPPLLLPMIVHAGADRAISSLAGVTGNRCQRTMLRQGGCMGQQIISVELASRDHRHVVAPGLIESPPQETCSAEQIEAWVPMKRMGS